MNYPYKVKSNMINQLVVEIKVKRKKILKNNK